MDDDTATEILKATYRVLCVHGYADLTLERIADEADRSKASIYHHYDSKEGLLIEFLDFLYDQYTAQLLSIDGGTPREQLYALLDTVLTDEDAGPDQEIRIALLEVKAQAPYNDALQTQLASFDEVLFDRLREIIAAGIEMGEFDATVKPAAAADFLVTAITGAHTRRVAVGYSSEKLYEMITRYAERQLFADEPSEAAH
ncbi:TetR/AcrR family transcriptional regulator [Halomicroarcula sp. F13]|uniref:TetR/AcrR family transcriptional regulator n=1 Tax=Haloarcula rubra TaxID=2487747 RepID=A0AAW4PYA6_9EURY|nr:TetR/AcrR family transcriptional regulator [Halomicroarcula rubra]MBX0325272.1 TetR/AcrR family transcriptional regulator [Halomicroarcula rubra]